MMDTKIPRHIAIIMDDHWRWAQQYDKKRTYGDYVDYLVFYDAIKAAVKLDVQYILSTFSIENWKRAKSEINFLIALLMWNLSFSISVGLNLHLRI